MSLATEEKAQYITEELERIAQNRLFTNSARLVRFLRFAVDEALNERGHLLKEYLIGTKVYDRPHGYDPRIDSVVRVEARRLRSKLKQYYETAGVASNFRIMFQTGSYAPTFVSIDNTDQVSRQPESRSQQRPTDLYTDGEGTGVAVLPFRCVTTCAQTAEFAAGLTDELAYLISISRGFRVLGHDAVPRACNDATWSTSIARERGIHVFLHGAVRRSRERYRVTAEMHDSTGFVVWSTRFDVDAENVESEQERIATSIAARLRLDYSPLRAMHVSPSRTAVRSLGLSMRGRQAIDGQGPAAIGDAIRLMTASAVKVQTCTRLWSTIADGHIELFRLDALEHEPAWDVGKPIVDRVLALDPLSSEGHCAAAGVHGWLRWNWTKASTHLRIALGTADIARAHHLHGLLLSYDGRFEEALGQLYQAYSLDSFSQSVKADIARTLFLARKYDALTAMVESDLERESNLDVLRYLGLAYVFSGALDKAELLETHILNHVPGSEAHRIVTAELAAWLGRPADATLVLKSQQISCAARAFLTVAIGDYPMSVAALSLARKKRSPIVLTLHFDARFDNLRRNATFDSIANQARVKFSD